MSLTTVADTLKDATGNAASATKVQVSWPAFFNTSNDFVPAENLTINCTSGAFTVSLEPSTDSTPPFAYSITYTFSDNTNKPDAWSVPRSGITQRVFDVHVASAPGPPVLIPLTQLAPGGATAGQVLMWNGSNWAPASLGPLTIPYAAAPSSNPTSAGILYVDSADGKLKYRGSSGTVTTIATP